MLRCVAELKSPKIGPGLLGREGFVEDTFGVSIQVVHDQCDPFAIGVPRIEQVAHIQHPVDFYPLGTGCACRNPANGSANIKILAVPFRSYSIVGTFSVVFCCRDGNTRYFKQLNRLLVHTKNRMGWIVGSFVNFEHFFYVDNKLGVRFRWNDPVLNHPLGHPVF